MEFERLTVVLGSAFAPGVLFCSICLRNAIICSRENEWGKYLLTGRNSVWISLVRDQKYLFQWGFINE